MFITKAFNNGFLDFPSMEMILIRRHAYPVFAVIPRAAHSVTHAAFSELPTGEADLRTGSAGGTRAVLVCAALLVLSARIRLVVVNGLVLAASLKRNSWSRADCGAWVPGSAAQRSGQVLDGVGIENEVQGGAHSQQRVTAKSRSHQGDQDPGSTRCAQSRHLRRTQGRKRERRNVTLHA